METLRGFQTRGPCHPPNPPLAALGLARSGWAQPTSADAFDGNPERVSKPSRALAPVG